MPFGYRDFPVVGHKAKNEKEALENIKDAIQEYLKTVEDLSKDQKSRYVEVG